MLRLWLVYSIFKLANLEQYSLEKIKSQITLLHQRTPVNSVNPLLSSEAFSLRTARVLIKFLARQQARSRPPPVVGWLLTEDGCGRRTRKRTFLSPSKSDSSIQTSKPNRKYKHFKANTENRGQDRPPDERAGKNLTKGLRDTLCTVCVYLHTRIQAAARGGTKKKRDPKCQTGRRRSESTSSSEDSLRTGLNHDTKNNPPFLPASVHFICLLLQSGLLPES